MAEEKEAKLKALDIALTQIERDYGKGAVMKMGEGPIAKIDAISTGSISLDWALGIGGIPRGRNTEIFGPESSGKTTLCLSVIAESQRQGGIAAFIDAEHALDLNYAKRIGVDTNNLLLSQPEFGEQALDIVETLVRSGAIDVVVIDSVAALTPRAEIEGEMGDAQMGAQARLMSQALRKLTAAINKSNTSVIFTNQLRSKIGIVYGNPETTTGGNALKFYAALRLDIRKRDHIKEGQDIVGNRVRVKVVKNKVAPPFKEVEFDIQYNEGISRVGDLLDVAVDQNIVQKSGTWFSYKNERLGQGRDAAKKYFQENPSSLKDLESEVRTKFGLPSGAKGANEKSGSNGSAPQPEKSEKPKETRKQKE